jgi:peptidyl-prolyl cis-trans isomerase B (cyclophilin B)
MTPVIGALAIFFSVLVPQKMWFAPSQPLLVTDKSSQDVALIMTDFSGKPQAAKGPAVLKAGATVDVKNLFPTGDTVGTWILYAVPTGSPSLAAATVPKDFLGTPLVIEVLQDPSSDGPQVTRVVPLEYTVMQTDAGTMKMIFYYDAAPHTVDTFLTLSAEGFYDGLTFHRIVPDFVIQGGDPLATGTGGPGFHLDAEFSGRPHLEGVLSMARNGDPDENPQTGTMPRPQYANSAGSQFFICLDYRNTQQLDHYYTAFGQVVEGFDVAQKIGKSPLIDPQNGTPRVPTVIQSVKVYAVTAAEDPYLLAKPTTAP